MCAGRRDFFLGKGSMQVAAENLDKVPNTAGLQKGQPAFLSVDGPREKLRRMAGVAFVRI